LGALAGGESFEYFTFTPWTDFFFDVRCLKFVLLARRMFGLLVCLHFLLGQVPWLLLLLLMLLLLLLLLLLLVLVLLLLYLLLVLVQ